MEGKITSILRQKGDKNRVSVHLDGEFAFGLNDQTIEQFRLRKGDYLDRELHGKIQDFDYWVDAKRIALAYLNYRARSAREIHDRLKREDVSEEIIIRVLEFLQEHQLINDEAWSKSFVNDTLIRKPVSSRQLEFGLAKKGVSKEIIERTLAELNATESDENRALRAAEKRWERILKSETDSRKRKQKLYTFLAARGFSFEVIANVYKTIGPEDDE